jgi:hypothetical protein
LALSLQGSESVPFSHAVDKIKNLLREGLKFFFSVNLSARGIDAVGIKDLSDLAEKEMGIGPLLRER